MSHLVMIAALLAPRLAILFKAYLLHFFNNVSTYLYFVISRSDSIKFSGTIWTRIAEFLLFRYYNGNTNIPLTSNLQEANVGRNSVIINSMTAFDVKQCRKNLCLLEEPKYSNKRMVKQDFIKDMKFIHQYSSSY